MTLNSYYFCQPLFGGCQNYFKGVRQLQNDRDQNTGWMPSMLEIFDFGYKDFENNSEKNKCIFVGKKKDFQY